MCTEYSYPTPLDLNYNNVTQFLYNCIIYSIILTLSLPYISSQKSNWITFPCLYKYVYLPLVSSLWTSFLSPHHQVTT